MAQKTFKTYLLHFTSPLHIGNAREDYGSSLQTIASDTMYAAITSALAMEGEPIPADGDLGCTISSLFPFCQVGGQESRILFFPRPQSAQQPQVDNRADAKSLKAVSWVDADLLQDFLAAGGMPASVADMRCVYDRFMTRSNLKKPFVHSMVSQRVTIESRDRREPPMPFYMDRVMFEDQSGLFFLCEGDSRLVDMAMPLLQQNGLGTDRNVGNGFFEYEVGQVVLDLPEDAAAALCLSTYIPTDVDELSARLEHPAAAYTLARRGGWITTPPNTSLRKKAIYALMAGSVVGRKEDEWIAGRIVDLKPSLPQVEHPIWRCGRTLFLPLNA